MRNFGFLVVGILGLLFFGGGVNAQSTEVDINTLLLHMDFTEIKDLAGKQQPIVIGNNRQVKDGVCGIGNFCYDIYNTGTNLIDIGEALLSDNQNRTIAFDGYIPTEFSSDTFFVSQYGGGNIGRFSIGRGLARNNYRVKLGNVNAESLSKFEKFDIWQHWVLSKNGDKYLLTVDKEELVNTLLSQSIQQVNTVVGIQNLGSQGMGYIDNLYIFNEAYPYDAVRDFIESNTPLTPNYQLSVSSPKTYQLFQRDENNQADILISGTLRGATEVVTLEMSYKNGPRIPIATTSGNFNYSFTGNVGQGDMKIRIAESPEVIKTISNVGVGDLYLLIGQSNQDGRGNNKNNAQVISGMIGVMYRNGTRQINNDPTGIQNLGSPRPLVANSLITEMGIPIGRIPKAQGGTSTSVRQKGQIYYTNAISAANEATNGNNNIKGVVWHQGESDSRENKERYYNNLSGIVNNLYNDINFEKFMVAIVSTPENGNGGGDANGPQQAQHQLIDDLDIAVQGPELYDITTSVDNLHYKTISEITELARRWTKHIEKEFYGVDFVYPEILGRYKYTGDAIALVLNQEAEVSNFIGEISDKAEGFNILNNGNTKNYTTSFTQKDGRYLLLIDIDEEVNENDLKITYAKTNAGYDKNVLRSIATKLSFNRNFDVKQIIPLTITNPTLTTSKTYDGTTTAHVVVGTLNGVTTGDDVNVIATATYDTATVGTNKTITVVYTLIGADASKYLPPVNYVVNNGEIISKPSGGASYSGGGGGGGSLSKDRCPNGDYSPSYYDESCGDSSLRGGSGETDEAIQGNETSDNGSGLPRPSDSQGQNTEILTAYQRAFTHNITTLAPITDANPDGTVIRGHLAKMIVNYAINVLGRTLPETIPAECHRKDESNVWESQEIKEYATKACQLGLMGIDMDYFQPNATVSRAQFGTILSRLLWQNTYAESSPYYARHLQALKEQGILTQIDNPEQHLELRQRVRLMLMRSTK